jgi:hypothetical protein
LVRLARGVGGQSRLGSTMVAQQNLAMIAGERASLDRQR